MANYVRSVGRSPSLRALTRKMGGEVVLPLTPSGARRSREWPAPHFAPALAHLERAPAHVPARLWDVGTQGGDTGKGVTTVNTVICHSSLSY